MTKSAAGKREASAERLNSYVTDMHALEMHIEKAIFAQIHDLDKDDPSFASALTSAHDTIAQHITRLGLLVESRGLNATSMVSDGVKKVVSVVAGLGAAAVDLVRSEDLPKNLRDDFAAFSLACVGYSMLHASAVVLGNDSEVSDLALSHMHDYAAMTSSLRALAPASVLRFLEKEGYSVSEKQLEHILEAQSAAASVV